MKDLQQLEYIVSNVDDHIHLSNNQLSGGQHILLSKKSENKKAKKFSVT